MTNKSTSQPHVIVLGNEKGGTGKSTTCMHVIVALLRLGYSVGSVDIDARQGTLTRYIENRQRYQKSSDKDIPLSDHKPMPSSTLDSVKEAQEEDSASLTACIAGLSSNDFIVIDTPGSNTYLSRLAHSFADTLITPLNDSLIDLDMLVRLKDDGMDIVRPSLYAEFVWEQKKNRAIRDGGNIDWIVLRNRLSNIHAKNKEKMEQVLSALSKRIGFRTLAGFGERVIFRELFLSGLTLLDMRETGQVLQLSHITAKQELRRLIESIQLPQLQERAAASL
ncbi:MAG: AAA family ATPase [Alphaproteobacteria bacterium]|jgi:chromosome partitioning protein|nr:AAA family ATPase [Alphaproteobacteria bacterium]MBT5389797.1 AAA family ATPase [Alphaproteobacteria bacterium]MBT5540123.1 AAA family ATPase [Alphaproteobacteria bacterium]MBT5655091.1 AAA family ATPase [Alphaproteobacteria bacterium]